MGVSRTLSVSELTAPHRFGYRLDRGFNLNGQCYRHDLAGDPTGCVPYQDHEFHLGLTHILDLSPFHIALRVMPGPPVTLSRERKLPGPRTRTGCRTCKRDARAYVDGGLCGLCALEREDRISGMAARRLARERAAAELLERERVKAEQLERFTKKQRAIAIVQAEPLPPDGRRCEAFSIADAHGDQDRCIRWAAFRVTRGGASCLLCCFHNGQGLFSKRWTEEEVEEIGDL